MTPLAASALLTEDHRRLKAVIYVRQSTNFQVRHHIERQKLQYDLERHAEQLGFAAVETIDDDQGISGSGVQRPGFERLLTMVCKGEVGLVLALEASRLARNGRDWHTLLDFCAVVGCLVGDRERLYDPGQYHDRTYLGLTGEFSSLERSLFRVRAQESLQAMAQRGELFPHLPAGYEKTGPVTIAMTPDQRQRDAIALVFRKFSELRSLRQVYLWFVRKQVEIPVRYPAKGLVWKVPTLTSVSLMLSNPIYAGAYAFGRRRAETVLENGRKRVRRRSLQQDPQAWTVLLKDRHEGYITWEEYERNQAQIAANRPTVRGAARRGRALLAGLLRCGRCDRRIQVRDNGRAVGYRCDGRAAGGQGGLCQSFGAVRVDKAVGAALLEAVRPLAVEAAQRAWEERAEDGAAEQRLARSALEEARYRAARARAQFDAVDPANANVVNNLAAQWERCLVEVRDCEERLARREAARQRAPIGAAEQAAYLALGEDLERVWHDERATPQLRKTLLRAALVEITATVRDERIALLLHWQGGDHTELEVPRMSNGRNRWATDAKTVELVRELARQLPDASIAALLNRLGKRTGKGNSWTTARVRAFRTGNGRGIKVYRAGERRERGELLLSEVAKRLEVDPSVVRRWIQAGILPARQACKGAPWILTEDDLELPAVRAALERKKAPLTPDPNQQVLDFQ